MGGWVSGTLGSLSDGRPGDGDDVWWGAGVGEEAEGDGGEE